MVYFQSIYKKTYMKMLRVPLITCLILLSFGLYTDIPCQELLTAERMHDIPRVGSPKLSPKGDWLLYSRSDVDLAANSSRSYLKLLKLSGGQELTIEEDGASVHSGIWVSDARIWYISRSDGKSHVWESDLQGNKKQITKGDFDVKMFGTNANATRIWVVRDVAFPTILSGFNEDMPKATGARVYDGLMYRHWTSWYDFKHQHVFTANIVNGEAGTFEDIMKEEPYDSPLKPFGSAGQINMDPTGRYIAYTSKKLSGTAAAISTNSGIYLYDTETKKTTLLTENNQGYDTYPAFSPDGKWLTWLSMQTPGYEADKNRLMLRDMSNGKVYELTGSFENGADAAKWDPQPGVKKIYFLAGVEATFNMYNVEWSDPEKPFIEQITNEIANYQDFSLAKSGRQTKMVASRMSMTDPTEIFEVSLSDGTSKRITFDTDKVMSGISKSKVEKRWVPTSDGKQMLTWIIYPPDFDPSKKYPALLYCQGGPQSAVSQFFSFRWNFLFMASQGYIVVAPNRRGLPSFGQAWNEQISGDWGGQAMSDLLSAIDNVAKEPFVDENRLGAVGASFGGYSVYWLAGNHNKRFKAFISHCGVFNLESMYGSTEEMFFVHHDLGGAYWEQPMPVSYKKHSPHLFVDKWDTPLLVIHNELDFRVPLAQGMEAFTAAQLKGIPSRFLYFEDEGHWVNKPQNSVVWNRVFFDWLDTYLK